MTDAFFDRPILNSPYAPPREHWELDESGQPTSITPGRYYKSRELVPGEMPGDLKRARVENFTERLETD